MLALFAEDCELGRFKPRPSMPAGEDVVYRGWMLTPDAYTRLWSAVENNGGRMLTSPQQYRRCHHLPEWYPSCEDLTPKTVFLERNCDFPAALSNQNWRAYFVKDYVKSLTTSRGSVAKTSGEIGEIVALIEKFRGQVEGGVCVREFENLSPGSEERYFVFRRQAFGRAGPIPQIVEQIAARIDSPFFCVDIAQSIDGSPRLIELGDGQVSDRKNWPVDRFVDMFKG